MRVGARGVGVDGGVAVTWGVLVAAAGDQDAAGAADLEHGTQVVGLFCAVEDEEGSSGIFAG